jgi:CHAT domain-containing protein
MRPVLRAPRLPVQGACKPRAEIRSAVVLADASGDLPDARVESSRVASLFGTTPLVGAAATSTALFSAKADLLLHVAVHAADDDGGGTLKLHDRAVSAAEISANKLGPSLVVLSGCGTARAGDPEIAGALSTAFLAGGSQRVVATLRPVHDHDALVLTSRFYDAQGAKDPVRVLAKVQAELANSDNKVWPNFAVFGSEVCPGS